MMSRHILIVEDEIKIAQLLADYFHANQFQTTLLHEGDEVINTILKSPPDLILLDLMLPGKDGLEICREVRQISSTPIIIITARIEEIDRILGLEIGADDYICKPFSPREVVARAKAIFRRIDQATNVTPLPGSPLQIDEENFQASFNNIPLELTPVEFRLLHRLNKTPGKIYSRDQLMTVLYADNRIVTDRTVDSHVKNLRKKLNHASCGEDVIRSVYGLGYKCEW